MQNEEGKNVDLYIPRKWYGSLRRSSVFSYQLIFSAALFSSATNRLITGDDHASIQLNLAHLDANGQMTGEFTPLAICGFVRQKGESDGAVNRLAQQHGFLKNVIEPVKN
jgi:small subunit ribosomal protein S21e